MNFVLNRNIKKEDKKLPEIPRIKSSEKYQRIADKEPDKKKEPSWTPIHRAGDGQRADMVDSVVKTTNDMRRGINQPRMAEAYRNNDISGMVATVPFDDYDEGIARTEEQMFVAFEEAGQGMIIHLPPKYRGIAFDATTEIARGFVESQGARLVGFVTTDTRIAIRNEIDRAFIEGLGADETARNITNIAGLTQRQAGAVTNFRRRVIEAGGSRERAERMARTYSDRLLRYRAENIARTELMTAANAGHREMIRQGVNQGVIPENVQKVFITTPDDRTCSYCAPLNGQIQNIDKPFDTGLGEFQYPPIHPQCRCVTGTYFP